MRNLRGEFGKQAIYQGARLTADAWARGCYVAPPGHNRDSDVEVEFHLVPAAEELADVPPVAADVQMLFDEAIAGLCDVLFENESDALIGFKIVSIAIRPEPLNALLPISCRRAARLAAASLLRDVAIRQAAR